MTAFATLSGSLVVLILLFVLAESLPALGRIGVTRFFTDPAWHPTEGQFTLLPMAAGTLLISLAAIALATPFGVASGVFCRFYAPPRVASSYRRLLEVLAGVPSVVYGLWGLVVLAPLVGRLAPPGTGLLTGALVLAVMILPTVALSSDASLEAVPRGCLLGAFSLGLSRWTTVRRVALPAARSGIVTGVILGAGRAIGETMAVLMVCGNVAEFPASLYSPVRTLTSNIALEMAYAMDTHRSALFTGGLLLILLACLLVLLADRAAVRWRCA